MPNHRTMLAEDSPPAAPVAKPAAPAWRLPALPSWKQVWFQLHWFIGITAGTVLVVIGLTGALLTFREEALDLINPGVRHVTPSGAPALTPQQIVKVVSAEHGERRIASMTLSSEPGAAVRVIFAPAEAGKRGESMYVQPYTGAIQPPLVGREAVEWLESLHRWLLLPRDSGRKVAGALALCLLGMALSGLYLRWPRRPLDWRSWLTFDPALRGRSFLWNLHAVAGTWVLVLYVIFTTTGVYWSYDVVRDNIDAWGGLPKREAPKPMDTHANKHAKKDQAKGEAKAPLDLTLAWSVFEQQARGWTNTTLRVPEKPGQAVQYTWLSLDSPHERARNRLSVMPLDGKVTQDDHYARQSVGARLINSIYPLHMGTYFGLPGRIMMLLASLALPGFAITGWILYLNRRRAKRAAQAERAKLGLPQAIAGANDDVTLVAYASQSGQAEKLALQSAGALQKAGLSVVVSSLDRLEPQHLRQYRRALFVASSFGEGEAPDGARRFARLLCDAAAPGLPGLNYGLLALGDRHYSNFCGFGRTLDQRLRSLGASTLFPSIEVDNHDAAALDAWARALCDLSGGSPVEAFAAPREAAYEHWRLSRRTLLNHGSQGNPLYEVALVNHSGATWEAGALVDILPRNAPQALAAFLQASGLSGTEQVRHQGRERTLAEALDHSALPPADQRFASAQACADSLVLHAPRSYSLASLPQDGELQLLVRQERHADGLGLASGWLTEFAPIGMEVELRLMANPGFAPELDSTPCIFIGNGSGLAGLRSHLRARIDAGQHRNWLLFGERDREHDSLCAAEIDGWLADGSLARLDRAFSRDPVRREYVQDRVRNEADEIRGWLAQGALIYVCGSLKGMAAGVDAALAEMIGKDALEELMTAGRYRRDVY
ncbi:PepSY domain-containing protein [Janthinobacterium agaricidamnosum]|uniref:Flavodoxin family protein n=1 Tax=Janthinobacterium agaricidamnosum NBRC 102515 = DSM 9628 TaxID=1349767 RepID=W0V494_9BURK|nr:sulfite reductase flavoprotein subunit alpha [Janthinobacterium agaricidamnosum]CDG83649.1 flavodoxin family protein [Janthinobacterium agaricidamnosum NBRC 102515 = DSM 9628]